MAELAGLIISGAGLAALFDSCLNAFNYIEAGTQYGREYNKAALKISLLQLRLTRWKETVRFVEDVQEGVGVVVAKPEEAEKVRELLGQIVEDFEEAERRGRRYKLKETVVESLEGREDRTIEALTGRVRKLALSRQKAGSLRQKTMWALHDGKKFDRLIEDQTSHIGSLVELFPAVERTQALADSEAMALVKAETKEENPVETVQVLEEAVKGVDPAMEGAVQKAAQAMANPLIYGGVLNVTGKARVADGGYIASDYKGPMYQDQYAYTGTYNASGEARVSRGIQYGGKSFWED